MTLTSMKLIGNHFLASFQSKSRNVITDSPLNNHTHATQTVDWIANSRHVMLKLVPETTY